MTSLRPPRAQGTAVCDVIQTTQGKEGHCNMMSLKPPKAKGQAVVTSPRPLKTQCDLIKPDVTAGHGAETFLPLNPLLLPALAREPLINTRP